MSPSEPPSKRGARRPPRPGESRGSGAPTKKAAAKKPVAKKPPARKATGTKKASAAKKAPAKKAPAKKVAAKKAPARKTASRPVSPTKSPTLPGPRRQAKQSSTPKPLPRAARSSARFRDVVTGAVPVVMVDEDTGASVEARVDPRDMLPEPPPAKTAFRQRYGVFHNTQGPRMRLGVAWVLVVVASLAFEPLRPYGLATVYAIAAGFAAMQVVDASHEDRVGTDRMVAALGAATLPILATVGTRWLGVGLLTLVAVAVGAAISRPRNDRDMPAMAAAGHTVLAAGMCGGAAASLVLLANYEIGAVIILLIYLMVYDASDYIVGSGSTNGIEGPLAGGLFIAATTMFLAVIEVPPFRGVDIWNFALLAALACPLGQVVASAMLPSARSEAPALRRIDSMLVVAPLWAGLIGLYLQASS